MGENTGIEWADHSMNLWWGCKQVENNRGCDHCYARDWEKRFGGASHWGNKNLRRQIETVWMRLMRLQNRANKAGRLDTVFMDSMSDIFEHDKMTDRHGNTSLLRKKFFQQITDGLYPNLIFLFLTKRPENMMEMLPDEWYIDLPPNLWFGVSLSKQENVDSISTLARHAPMGAKLFLSVEPILSYIDIGMYLFAPYLTESGDERTASIIDWVICGGESGEHARPSHIDWVLRLASDCHDAKVPFFFKQWGELAPSKWDDKWHVNITPDGKIVGDEEFDPIMSHQHMTRYGIKNTGHLIDGYEIRQLPKELQSANRILKAESV